MTYDPGRGTGRVPVVRNEWREPLRAQRDPVAEDSGRLRSNRDDRQQWRKQTWLGRFVSTYGWRAYALPVMRHRVFRNFAAVSDGITTDAIIARVLEHVAEPDYR